jgi:NADP-dependent 3-hydroxy acid dehydrogenase YdfG
LRLELADTAIRVILIEPGPITSQLRNNAVPHFEKWIDWENSARRDGYQEELNRLYTQTEPTKYELPPSAVTKKLLHAVTSPNPKPRYYVTKPTYLMGFLKRFLSTRMLDRLILRG